MVDASAVFLPHEGPGTIFSEVTVRGMLAAAVNIMVSLEAAGEVGSSALLEDTGVTVVVT